MKTLLLNRWNSAWNGQYRSIGSVFIFLAVWNTIVSAINFTWLRDNAAARLYMTPVSLAMPILVCIGLALLTKVSMKALAKTALFTLSVAIICIVNTDPAELNRFMLRN